MKRRHLEELDIEAGFISRKELSHALDEQKISKEKPDQILLKDDHITEDNFFVAYDLKILTDLIQAVHKSSSLEDIYRVALDSVIELENVDAVMIYLVDEQKREAVLQAHRNVPEDYIRRAGRIPYPKGITWKAINSGRIINIEDAQKDSDTGPAGKDLRHHGSLAIPITLEEKVIGVIWFVSYREHKFNEREVNLLSTLGNQIAIAISRAKQTEELEERNKNLSILSVISQAVHGPVDLDQIYRTVLDLTKDLKFIDIMSVYLVEGQGDKREAVAQVHWGYPEEFLKKAARIPYPRGNTWKVIESGEPVYYENASDPSTPVGPAGKALGQRALLSIPVKSGSDTIGVVHFSSLEKIHFTKEELDFLLSLGSQIGTAIAKAKLFEEIKQRKEVLERQTKKLQQQAQLLDLAYSAIMVRDMNSAIIFWNRDAEKMYGWTKEEALGNSSYVLLQTQFPKLLEEIEAELFREGCWEGELIHTRYDGNRVLVLSRWALQRDEHSKPLAILEINTDITERKRAEEELSAAQKRLTFLADASAILSGSLDYETTLKNVARLAVPEIADWCAVDIIDEDGSLKRLAVAHIDPAKVDLAYEIECRYPTCMDAPYGMPNVLLTSKPELYPEIPDSLLVEVARDAEHLQILHDLGLKSAISVPLLARGQMFGVITFVMARLGRRYNSDDLAFAEDLARRTAYAIDNARLYRSARRMEEQFSSFMRNLPAATWIKDTEGHYVYANRISEEIFHTKLTNLIGKTDEEIFPVDMAKQFKENDRLVITRGESVQTIETLPQDDEIRHSIVSKFPIFDHNGTLVMVGGVAIDATERMKAEEALRQSEERYRTLFDQSPVGVYLFNSQFQITECNKRMIQILRSSYDKIMGLDMRRLKDQSLMPAMEKVFEGQSSHQESFYEATTSSAKLWLSLSLTPLRDTNGKVVGGMAVVEDITERKRMEEELLKAQKLESIGILAGGIAHDFNNLLTAILGNISLTKMYTDSKDKMDKRLSEAEKACLRAKDLTQQLLTFSKGGAPVKRVTSIEELIKDSASFAVSGSDVRCEFHISGDLWMVEVDEGQISQAINNVVINADQATPEGGVIRVKAENISRNELNSHSYYKGDGLPLKSGRYVKITIEDEGIGIPEQHLSKIFDPYFTTKQKGSGIGLAAAYSIIKNHDGYIGVESKLEVGTKFYIYLPASEKEIPAKVNIKEGPVVGKGRILVMDDEDMIRGLAGEMLSQIGYEVEFARDGREVIELYKEAVESGRPFDVVIMDLTIPGGMGGREAIKRLLEIDPGVKAIVSSGYSNDPAMSEYKEYGFSGVVSKPYSIEDLAETLHKVVNEE